MKHIHWLTLLFTLPALLSCQAQTNNTMQQNSNPLLCDPAEGICAMPDSTSASDTIIPSLKKPATIIYFTDPICSSCWGIEPELRKLKLEYGQEVEIEYRMGGLLPDWSYNSGGISKPSDVAHHWDEVSVFYDMPIDGDVWLEDPLHSSYPPSTAFKAAQMQDKEKALVFLRLIREMVFLDKKNITKWEHLEVAAAKAGLDAQQLKKDFEGPAKELFEEDLKLARQMGVRGFPTMFFTDTAGKREIVYGSKPYSAVETALLKVHPGAAKKSFDKHWEYLFGKYPTLTAKEFSVLSDMPRTESEALLNRLVGEGKLEKFVTKNGSIWRRI